MLTKKKKPKKTNRLLIKVIIISIGIHVLIGLFAGFITFINSVKKDTVFEDAAPTEAEEPPAEVEINIEQPQPDLNLPELTSASIPITALSNLNINTLPSLNEGFGLSSDILDTATNIRSLDFGISKTSVFGIKSEAERFLILIEANRRMLTDDKGGLNSFKIIKDEISKMVDGFSPGTLFNVAFYDQDRVLFFKPKLVSVGWSVAIELKKWMEPINSNPSNIGIRNHPDSVKINIQTYSDELVHASLANIQWDGNQVGLITQLALEQQAEAIYILTGYHRGFEELRRRMNSQEELEWEDVLNSNQYQHQLKKHLSEIDEMQERIDEKMKAINERRAKKGEPPRILGNPGNIYACAQELGMRWKTKHPGDAPSYLIDRKEIEDYFEKVASTLYPSDKKFSVNVVLFLGENEEYDGDSKRNLRKYVRFFNGNNRIIKGSEEIKAAQED